MYDLITHIVWKEDSEPAQTAPHTKYYDHDTSQHVARVFLHKGVMQPNRPLGYVDNRVFAFVPEQGTWLHLNPVGGVLPVHEDARYTILRYGNVHYLPGFGEALTKAAQVWIRTYGGSTGSWPPEREARRIVIHGVGTRLARVIFWEHDGKLPREFALRLDEGTNVEPVLYDALIRRFAFTQEIQFWNLDETSWETLTRETDCSLAPRYSTICVRAPEAGFTPGLGWEITQLERQRGRLNEIAGMEHEERDAARG